MKRLLSFFALIACLFVRADNKTDFPVELLGDLNGMSVPRLKSYTTGEIVKFYANTFPDKKWTETSKRVKRRFFYAVGELLEIVDKSDFIQLWRDFGYEFYSGSNTSRKIDITGFYNESGAPTMNDAVSRVFNICKDPLHDAVDNLDSALGFDYDDSFRLEVEAFSVTVFDFDIYIDCGDIAMLAAFGKAAEGALYLLRGLNIDMDYPTVINAVEEIVSDVQDGADFVDAFDASPFARLNVRSKSDLQFAREAFASAISYATTGDALVKGRKDTNEHLIRYTGGGVMKDVIQMLIDNKDDILSFIDQLITPVNISSAVVSGGVLELTYTGGTQSPTIGRVTVNGAGMPYDLTGVTSATEAGTYEMTLVGYGRSTGTKKVTWKIVIPPPSVSGDKGANVQEDGKGGFEITPSTGTEDVDITIPLGVDATKVVVEVSPDTKSVKPNGATVKIVRNGNDITDCLNIPSPDASGVVNLASAVVKEEIVRETLDVKEGAVVNVGADDVSITTAKTRPGLVYTLVEGASLNGMGPGVSKIGDGAAWTPKVSVKGGKSGFYFIRVTK